MTKEDAYLHTDADEQALSGDHVEICQFENNEAGNQRFKPVCHALRRLLDADRKLAKAGGQYALKLPT